ncbi:MAG: hypothetical protein JW953_12185 [Anaerolineae bacterium]|nr:hypothetical protein [Anaerolineae bacterium]
MELYRGDLPLGNKVKTKNAAVLAGGHNPILPAALCDQVGLAKAGRSRSFASSPNDPARIYLLGDIAHLEDLYLDGGIDKDRYLLRKSEIDQAIATHTLEDQLYTATQTFNFNQVITRMRATPEQIPAASPKTKKTPINSIFGRLEIGGGKVIHLTPRPWPRPFF